MPDLGGGKTALGGVIALDGVLDVARRDRGGVSGMSNELPEAPTPATGPLCGWAMPSTPLAPRNPLRCSVAGMETRSGDARAVGERPVSGLAGAMRGCCTNRL
jgi:hypothetical protein